MDLKTDIASLLSSGRAPERQWLDEVTERYPYFTLPLLLHVKHSGDRQELQRLATLSPDRRDLAITVGSAPEVFANFYPDDEPHEVPSVDSIIDKFLDTYAQGTDQKEIDALNKAIFHPTPDYADILSAQDNGDALGDKEDELISSFIANSRRQEREVMAQMPAVEHHLQAQDVAKVAHDNVDNSTQNDDSMLSESLAKVYIARGKYSKALEIIESINLNFPEKSIYFADQIRFLRKLVLIETLKNKL